MRDLEIRSISKNKVLSNRVTIAQLRAISNQGSTRRAKTEKVIRNEESTDQFHLLN